MRWSVIVQRKRPHAGAQLLFTEHGGYRFQAVLTDRPTWKPRCSSAAIASAPSCAAVWAAILDVARRRLEPGTRNTLWLSCIGWWSGWMLAAIARLSYPPPKKLKPGMEKRLGLVSIVLIAAGVISVIRLLATGRRPATSATQTSGARSSAPSTDGSSRPPVRAFHG
jgi:hypothetical protein